MYVLLLFSGWIQLSAGFGLEPLIVIHCDFENMTNCAESLLIKDWTLETSAQLSPMTQIQEPLPADFLFEIEKPPGDLHVAMDSDRNVTGLPGQGHLQTKGLTTHPRGHCLQFFYLFKCDGECGSITVFTIGPGARTKELWASSTDTNRMWRFYQVSLPRGDVNKEEPFEVVISAQLRQHNHAALDDISVLLGACSDAFEGDQVVHGVTKLSPLADASRAIFNISMYRNDYNWPGGRVPYVMDPAYTADEADKIVAALQEFHKHTCVRFVPWKGEAQQLYFNKTAVWCLSDIGRYGAKTQTWLADFCLQGVFYPHAILHEILHALGFFHEHTRNDRDMFIKILWQNFRREQDKRAMRLEGSYGLIFSQLHGTTYDYCSILHYSSNAYAKRGERSMESRLNSTQMLGNTRGLSILDVVKVNRLYNCDSTQYLTEAPEPLDWDNCILQPFVAPPAIKLKKNYEAEAFACSFSSTLCNWKGNAWVVQTGLAYSVVGRLMPRRKRTLVSTYARRAATFCLSISLEVRSIPSESGVIAFKLVQRSGVSQLEEVVDVWTERNGSRSVNLELSKGDQLVLVAEESNNTLLALVQLTTIDVADRCREPAPVEPPLVEVAGTLEPAPSGYTPASFWGNIAKASKSLFENNTPMIAKPTSAVALSSERYVDLRGNCRGRFLRDNLTNEMVGCGSCDRSDCEALCEKWESCAGFSFIDREVASHELSCYLKTEGCQQPELNTEYKFWQRRRQPKNEIKEPLANT